MGNQEQDYCHAVWANGERNGAEYTIDIFVHASSTVYYIESKVYVPYELCRRCVRSTGQRRAHKTPMVT